MVLLWRVKDWKDLKFKVEMLCFCGMHFANFSLFTELFFLFSFVFIFLFLVFLAL